MIVQNVSADGKTTDLTFTVPAADYQRSLDTIAKAKAAIGYTRLDGATDVAKISVIGIGMRSHAGVAAQAFSALGRAVDQYPRHHHLGDQVLAADRRGLYRACGAHAAFALRPRQSGAVNGIFRGFSLQRTNLAAVIALSLACGLHTAFDIGLRMVAAGLGPGRTPL